MPVSIDVAGTYRADPRSASMTTMILPALLLASTAAGPAPGPSRTFRDWTAACDNVRRCEAQALVPDGTDGGVVAILARDGGPDAAPTLTLIARATPAPAAAIIDGRRFATRPPGRSVAVAIAQPAQAIAAMAQGRRMQLVDARGGPAGTVSLAGMAAALRWVDERQGRAGGVTALVARGPAPAARVPAPPAAPAISAPRPHIPEPRIIPATAEEVARLRKTTGCDAESGPKTAETRALPGGGRLLLLACGAGAYNLLSVPLVSVGAGRTFVRARFDAPTGMGGDGGPPTLVNADWDAAAGTLSSYAKARGLGDCGGSERFVWDGTRFRLIEQRVMGECAGSTEWMRVWTARVVARR